MTKSADIAVLENFIQFSSINYETTCRAIKALIAGDVSAETREWLESFARRNAESFPSVAEVLGRFLSTPELLTEEKEIIS